MWSLFLLLLVLTFFVNAPTFVVLAAIATLIFYLANNE